MTQPSPPQPCDLLIEAGWVVPVEPHGVALVDHAVAVDGGRILAVMPRSEAAARFAPRQRVQRPGSALIPGLVNRGRKRAKLESVHVDPAQRSRGIGAVMVAFAVDFARRNGAGLVELTSNKSREAAHRFYRRLGFEQSHEGFKMALSP